MMRKVEGFFAGLRRLTYRFFRAQRRFFGQAESNSLWAVYASF
jgi:hypothetical protein